MIWLAILQLMVPRSSLPLSQSNAYTVVLHTRTPGVQSYTHTLHYHPCTSLLLLGLFFSCYAYFINVLLYLLVSALANAAALASLGLLSLSDKSPSIFMFGLFYYYDKLNFLDGLYDPTYFPTRSQSSLSGITCSDQFGLSGFK